MDMKIHISRFEVNIEKSLGTIWKYNIFKRGEEDFVLIETSKQS
jgi:hypothetical protein